MDENIIEIENLSKSFPGVIALDNISLRLPKGQIHALIGKNGSGKSTFVNILTGVFKQDAGKILIAGKLINFNNSADAIHSGVCAVHQENSLIQDMTVLENIFLGRWPTHNKMINWQALDAQASLLIKDIAPHLDLYQKVENLSVGAQQIVEILKAISTNPHLLLLDEPTSALSQTEAQLLFKVLNRLRRQGCSMIYITHRLQELEGLVDTVSVLRDGQYIGSLKEKDFDIKKVITMMFGDYKHSKILTSNYNPSKEHVLELENLTSEPYFSDVSLQLKKGEILGIAGMLGAGRTELFEAIYGLRKTQSGIVRVLNEPVKVRSPKIMKDKGVAFIPEDRRYSGLISDLGVHENLCLVALEKIKASYLFLSEKIEQAFVDKQISDLDIKIPNAKNKVATLSGGNQQKVVVGKWLNNKSSIFLCDEPSRGIDIKAKMQIFQILVEQKSLGVSSLVISSELEELLLFCDRILIMRKGRIYKELENDDSLNAENLYEYCMEKLC